MGYHQLLVVFYVHPVTEYLRSTTTAEYRRVASWVHWVVPRSYSAGSRSEGTLKIIILLCILYGDDSFVYTYFYFELNL